MNELKRTPSPHDFKLVNLDTDSISFCKPDGEEFSEDERTSLLNEINALTPEKIIWEDDGYYEVVLIVKAKNYALIEKGSTKVKIKGSALKATTKEPALKEMIKRCIDSFLGVTSETIETIYLEYVKEAYSITDINRWGAKKSVTEAVLKGSGTSQVKMRHAIKGEGLQMGDKFFVYFAEDDSLVLTKYFDGCYNKTKMLKKVHDTIKGFSTVYDVKKNLLNYSLKGSKKALDKLVGNVVVIKGEKE